MYILTEEDKWLCDQIVDCAFKVHKNLGPGLLEKIYETCFCYELDKKELSFRRQVYLPIQYDGLIFDEGLKIDVFVEDKIICEIKAVDKVNPVWQAQIISHLKLSSKNIGYILNFNVPLIKGGIRRYCEE